MTKKQKLGPNQEKWLHDLETTKAEQITGVLANGHGGYCCLGRAEVTVGKKKVGDLTGLGGLTDDTMKALAMGDGLGYIRDYHDNGSYHYDFVKFPLCSSMNDQKKWSFKKIAAFIRKNPDKYFLEPK